LHSPAVGLTLNGLLLVKGDGPRVSGHDKVSMRHPVSIILRSTTFTFIDHQSSD
jgi:hypothetical protein